jgi:hypothetical protein
MYSWVFCWNLNEYIRIRCHNSFISDLNTATVMQCGCGCRLSLLPGSGKRRNNLPYVLYRRYESIGIGTRLRAGRLGNRLSIRDRDKHFSVLRSTQTGDGTHPAFPGVNRLGRFPPIARLRNAWNDISILFHTCSRYGGEFCTHARIHTHKQIFVLLIVCSLVVRLTRLWTLVASYFENFSGVCAAWYNSKLGCVKKLRAD